MSYTELPIVTVQKFIPSWEKTYPQELVEQLISVSDETHRRPNFYPFKLKNGRLTDFGNGRIVLGVIKKETYLQKVEFEIAQELESWANRSEEGIAFWISPPYPGEYPCSKVIIHRIAYTSSAEKIVLNSAILFNAKFNNPESLRKTLFTKEESENTILEILGWVEEVSDRNTPRSEVGNITSIREQAYYFAQRIRAGDSKYVIAEEMQRMGFLGEYAISCGGGGTLSSLLRVSNETGLIGGEKFVRNCGNCGAPINSAISKGYRCSSCGGVYEGC